MLKYLAGTHSVYACWREGSSSNRGLCFPPKVPGADTPFPQPPCVSGRSQIQQSAGGVRPTDFNLDPTKRGVSSRPADKPESPISYLDNADLVMKRLTKGIMSTLH